MSYPDKDSFDGGFDWKGFVVAIGIIIFGVVVGVSIATALTGCASVEEIQILSNNSTAVANSQKEAAREQTPTMEFKCQGPCSGRFLDPRDRVKVTGVRITNTNDVVIKSMGPIITGIGYVAGAVAATRIFSDISSNMGGGNTNNTSTIIGNDNATDVGRTSAVGDTSTTDSSNSSTNNPDSSDSSTNDNSTNDSSTNDNSTNDTSTTDNSNTDANDTNEIGAE